MNEDWQSSFASNRHVHNRVGKQGRGKGGKSNGAFNVKRALGTYEIKCASAKKLERHHAGVESKQVLEIYNLNDESDALVGTISIQGVLEGTVILAGSRKVMQKAVGRFMDSGKEAELVEQSGEAESLERGVTYEADAASGEEHEDEDDKECSNEDEAGEELSDQRTREFEKNSFRSPKFWLKWQGHVSSDPELSTQDSDSIITDSGYIVFSGSSCDRFDGTLSCEPLGWKNVKITGWKVASKPARDLIVRWEPAGS